MNDIEDNRPGSLPKIKPSEPYGCLTQSYIKDGLHIKVYLREISAPRRMKTDMQIKEKIEAVLEKLSRE